MVLAEVLCWGVIAISSGFPMRWESLASNSSIDGEILVTMLRSLEERLETAEARFTTTIAPGPPNESGKPAYPAVRYEGIWRRTPEQEFLDVVVNEGHSTYDRTHFWDGEQQLNFVRKAPMRRWFGTKDAGLHIDYSFCPAQLGLRFLDEKWSTLLSRGRIFALEDVVIRGIKCVSVHADVAPANSDRVIMPVHACFAFEHSFFPVLAEEFHRVGFLPEGGDSGIVQVGESHFSVRYAVEVSKLGEFGDGIPFPLEGAIRNLSLPGSDPYRIAVFKESVRINEPLEPMPVESLGSYEVWDPVKARLTSSEPIDTLSRESLDSLVGKVRKDQSRSETVVLGWGMFQWLTALLCLLFGGVSWAVFRARRARPIEPAVGEIQVRG